MQIAIESALNLNERMYSWINLAINDHFEKLDVGLLEKLTINSLAINGAEEFKVKYTEFSQIITMYLQFRPELEVLTDRDKTIRRVGQNNDNALPMGPKECALRYYDKVCSVAPEIIDTLFQGLESGRTRVKIEDLQEKIAAAINVKPYVAYHCLRQYLECFRKDLRIKRGREGGLEYIPKV